MYNSQSINERLKNFAKKNNISNVERARVILCLERVIARLMQNELLNSKLIFGGGFVVYKEVNSLRFTKDIDAIIYGTEKDQIIDEVKKALSIDLEDGFWFGDLRTEKLEISSGYGGLRFKIPYKAGLPAPIESEVSRLRSVQLDISVGANLEEFSRPSLLRPTLDIYSEVHWNIYPLEFICAEKIHCLHSKGDLNTRGKDVYDLGLLLPEIDIRDLELALAQTFKNRSDDITQLKASIPKIDTEYLKESYLKVLTDQSRLDFDKAWKIIVKCISKLNI
jgi:predicted nucleotidyltransferase component of viral defense system